MCASRTILSYEHIRLAKCCQVSCRQFRHNFVQILDLLEHGQVAVLYTDHCLQFPVELLRRVQVLSVAILEISHFHNLKVVHLLYVVLDLVRALVHFGDTFILHPFDQLQHLLVRVGHALSDRFLGDRHESLDLSLNLGLETIIISQFFLHDFLVFLDSLLPNIAFEHHLLDDLRVLGFNNAEHLVKDLRNCGFAVVNHLGLRTTDLLVGVRYLVQHLHDN